MRHFTCYALTAALACFPVALLQSPAFSDEPTVPKGVEILARGPIHEAFAEPIDGTNQPAPPISKTPPDPIAEVPPDHKPAGDNVTWIPGYWAWDSDRNDYIWVSGVWRVPPDGRQWVPGYWQKTDDGWEWVPGFWDAAGNQDLNVLPPPPSSIDEGPSLPAPDDNYFYTPGVWIYRDGQFYWRPGYWVQYRAGLVWVPPHYIWTPLGWIFVEGYWDLPLEERGLLFAPVWLDPGVIVQRDFSYTPDYVVPCDFLFGSLFVRLHHHHYYYGDYFGDRYAELGYTPWIDFRFGKRNRDPLYNYYSHTRPDSWSRDTRALFASRFRSEDNRPPHSLAQQTTIVQRFSAGRNADPSVVRNNTVLTPIKKLDSRSVPLQTINRDRILQLTKTAEQTRDVARERRQLEHDMLAKGAALKKSSDPPRTFRLDTLAKVPTPSTQKTLTSPSTAHGRTDHASPPLNQFKVPVAPSIDPKSSGPPPSHKDSTSRSPRTDPVVPKTAMPDLKSSTPPPSRNDHSSTLPNKTQSVQPKTQTSPPVQTYKDFSTSRPKSALPPSKPAPAKSFTPAPSTPRPSPPVHVQSTPPKPSPPPPKPTPPPPSKGSGKKK